MPLIFVRVRAGDTAVRCARARVTRAEFMRCLLRAIVPAWHY
jgi:hypothetical protein